METVHTDPVVINGQSFEIIKPTRLRNGMVLKAGDTFARVGEKLATLDEQIHTVSLYNRGFPVPQVIDSGELPDDKWYFTETSLGTDTFHKQFTEDYRSKSEVSDKVFNKYIDVITKYAEAQSSVENRTTISPEDFIASLVPHELVLPNYCYFGHSEAKYLKALNIAAQRLNDATMGIIQHDLNPFNVLDNGIIDFELVGYGPVGFDTLMSARWSAGWFTDYPSRYPVAYKLSSHQITNSDNLIDKVALEKGCSLPSAFMQEFILLKSAWAVSEEIGPDPNWPADKLAFRNFRANVLEHVVTKYLNGDKINFTMLSQLAGGEVS